MMASGRAPARWGAWAIVGLLGLVPLFALASAVAFPAPDPFTGVAPSVLDLASRLDPRLWVRSVALSLGVALVAVPIGTWLAWLQQRVHVPGSRWVFLATLLPLAMPSYILAAAVGQGLGPGGWIPLFDQVSGLPAAVLVIGIVTVPYVQLIVGSALRRGSASEEEAARVLGASPWRAFVDVVWPRVRGAVAYSGLLAMLYALSDFGAVAVLDTPVLTWRLYQAVAGQELARAVVMGAWLIGSAVPLFVVARWVQGGGGPSVVANPRQPARRRMTRIQAIFCVASVALVVGLGVLFPVLSLVSWVVEGLRVGAPFADLVTPMLHTLLIASVGALVTVLLVLLPAFVVGGRRSGGGLEPATYMTSALPGVLLAFGWLLAALVIGRVLPGAYAWLQASGILLLIGYATRYLAEAYTPVMTSIWQFDRRQVDAHRVLGASNSRFGLRIVFPALWPSLRAGGLLAFLAILKELPVTLLLGGGTGLTTLAFRVWDRSSEALWHDAGAAGLVLLGLAAMGVGLTELQRA